MVIRIAYLLFLEMAPRADKMVKMTCWVMKEVER